MKANKSVLAFAFAFAVLASLGSELSESIYEQTTAVYSDLWEGDVRHTPNDHFLSVLDGGIASGLTEVETARFLAIVETVSNRCDEIAEDWTTYETNDMVRFTTINAVVYSGLDNYTNFTAKVLAKREANSGCVSWDTLSFLLSPYGTKQGEDYLIAGCDDKTASNLVSRIRSQAVSSGKTNAVDYCDYILSGDAKREYLILEAAGQLR